ncbi:MAG TPA: DNA mismatch repair protein MutS [Anaerolineae bacterium]|nr:DNA mismatch repair protein MutS [Anaerolineae bacterium]
MTTPMRRQYLRIKKQYPDTIVFFRLGDFYETFDDDARLVAQVCDIVLTSRPVGKDQRVPLAGVPYHSVEGYIARLIQAGHRVAIVEQVGEVTSNELVEREVVRVVTPGTVVEPSLLDERRNNYLAAAVVDGERAGLAYADITTGEFAATQFAGPRAAHLLAEELDRLAPAEIVTPQPAVVRAELALDEVPAGTGSNGQQGVGPLVTERPAWPFELETARQALMDHFEVASLDGFGLGGQPAAVRAAGGLLHYLADTQRGRLEQLAAVRSYSTAEFMALDASTRRNLELTETLRRGAVQGSLLGVLDVTVTSLGGRLLRKWLTEPLVDVARLQARLDAVQALHDDTPGRTRLRALLKDVSDLERLASRAVQGIARPRDLTGIRQTLEALPDILGTVDGLGGAVPFFASVCALDPCREVADLIAQALVDDPPATLSGGGVIRRGFSAELDNVLTAARDAKTWVANLEAEERRRTGIKNLKVGYNKVFGYYLEITRANADRVPDDYVRKQTLVNAERYIIPELKEYESLILNAEERIEELESRIFSQVVEQVAAAGGRLVAVARALAELDVYAALAEVALMHRYVRPRLTEEYGIEVSAGRHPVVEVTRRDEPFVPNDVRFSEDESILIITGPNMAGKSTYLRQVALVVLMAQIGSFVPADEARIGVVDRIFTRIGAQDEISAGQSTFMVEMVETANLLNHATARSLLVLDEVGRGTSTYDGISIAWSVVEHIHNHPRLRCKTLFATHYHELTQLSELLPRVRNYNVAVAEEKDRVVFLRRIVPGGADRSYGIHVAQLAGLPRPVINRAREILKELEQEARAPGSTPRRIEVHQLPLFATTNPALDELRQMDVSAMTPLEAISKLYELQKKAK